MDTARVQQWAATVDLPREVLSVLLDLARPRPLGPDGRVAALGRAVDAILDALSAGKVVPPDALEDLDEYLHWHLRRAGRSAAAAAEVDLVSCSAVSALIREARRRRVARSSSRLIEASVDVAALRESGFRHQLEARGGGAAGGWVLSCLVCGWSGTRVYQDLEVAESVVFASSRIGEGRCSAPVLQTGWVRDAVVCALVGASIGGGLVVPSDQELASLVSRLHWELVGCVPLSRVEAALWGCSTEVRSLSRAVRRALGGGSLELRAEASQVVGSGRLSSEDAALLRGVGAQARLGGSASLADAVEAALEAAAGGTVLDPRHGDELRGYLLYARSLLSGASVSERVHDVVVAVRALLRAAGSPWREDNLGSLNAWRRKVLEDALSWLDARDMPAMAAALRAGLRALDEGANLAEEHLGVLRSWAAGWRDAGRGWMTSGQAVCSLLAALERSPA